MMDIVNWRKNEKFHKAYFSRFKHEVAQKADKILKEWTGIFKNDNKRGAQEQGTHLYPARISISKKAIAHKTGGPETWKRNQTKLEERRTYMNQ